MTTSKPDWWDWKETRKELGEPIRLREDAPEEIKKQFEEWQKQQEELKKMGYMV